MLKRIFVCAWVVFCCLLSHGFTQDISRLDPPSIIRGDVNLIQNGVFTLCIYGGYFYPRCIPNASYVCELTNVNYPPPIVKFGGTAVPVTSRQLLPRADGSATPDPDNGFLYEAELIKVAIPPALIARTGNAPNPGFLVEVQIGVTQQQSPTFAPSYLPVDWRIEAAVGTGLQGHAGDDGDPKDAKLNFPATVAFNGNYMYIADTCNNCIRRVNFTTNRIERFAGQCQPDNTLSCDDPIVGGYMEGPALTVAQFKKPFSIAFDASNNLYITDSANHCIRRVGTSSPNLPTSRVAGVCTVEGNTNDVTPVDALMANLNSPIAIAFDSQGNYYISDTLNHRIRKVTSGPTPMISAFACTQIGPLACLGFAGDGLPASQARFSGPSTLSFSSDFQKLFIADYGNKRARYVDMATLIINSAAGIGMGFADPGGYVGDFASASQAWLNWPIAVTSPLAGTPFANHLFISDRHNNRIRQIGTDLKAIKTIAGYGAGGFGGDFNPADPATYPGLATNAQLFQPTGMALTLDGQSMYIVDNHNHKIRKISR